MMKAKAEQYRVMNYVDVKCVSKYLVESCSRNIIRLSKGFVFKWKTSVHDRQDLVSPLSVQSRILEFC